MGVLIWGHLAIVASCLETDPWVWPRLGPRLFSWQSQQDFTRL